MEKCVNIDKGERQQIEETEKWERTPYNKKMH